MLERPMKRICPSVIFIARSKTPRHLVGLMNGRNPSTTSISANAPTSKSQKLSDGPKAYFFEDGATTDGAEGLLPRMAWKKSLLGSSTITSDLLRKLALYASRLR
jgi:hypothetical protein